MIDPIINKNTLKKMLNKPILVPKETSLPQTLKQPIGNSAWINSLKFALSCPYNFEQNK